MRIKDKKNKKKTNMIGFTNENNSLVFSVINEKIADDYALINKDFMNVKSLNR